MTLIRENEVDEDVELAVKHGMYWLDENVYDWVEVINLDMLEMESGDHCVLGQQWTYNNGDAIARARYSPYMDFVEEAHPNLTPYERIEWAERNGFYIDDSDEYHSYPDNAWQHLGNVWKEKIKERLNER